MEKQVKMVRRLSRRSQEIFLNGLKKYQARGVRILVDGKDAMPEDMERLLEEYEDGSFYMGDYIWEENRYTAILARENKTVYRAGPGERTGKSLLTAAPEQSGAVAADNLQGKRLKEIHFDRVYYR